MGGYAGSRDPGENSLDLPAVNKTISGKIKGEMSCLRTPKKNDDVVTVDPHENKKTFPIGHSNHKIDEFIGLLKLHGVNTLVDVRGSPSSKRFPQYNKQELIVSCSINNIAYRHCSQLGNKQKEIQALIELPAGQDAIRQLSEEYFASGNSATAIMCSEHDSDTCHRKIVAQRLFDDYSINTKHISRSGLVKDHVILDDNASRVRQAFGNSGGNNRHEKSALGQGIVVGPNASRVRQATGHDVGTVGQEQPASTRDYDLGSDANRVRQAAERDVGIVPHVTTTERQNPVAADLNASRVRQAIAHDPDLELEAIDNGEPLAMEVDHNSRPAEDQHPMKPKRGKSILISVPQKGKSYTVSESIIKKTHTAITKRSGGSLNAYLGNVMNYDKSRKFIEEYAVKAASQAKLLCKPEKDFPELFQLSYKWVYDTGASTHFCGQEAVNSFKEYLHNVRASYVSTAAGLVTMDKALKIKIERLDGLLEEILVLPNTPGLMSAGKLQPKGFSF